MPTRRSSARWEGGLKGGKGTFTGESGAIGGQYSFSSRFESGVGSNPEELLAAAEAACFSMAFAGNLEKNGTPPTSIESQAACTVEPVDGKSKITKIHVDTTVVAAGIDQAKLDEIAETTVQTCPVSGAFHGNVELTVKATLSRT